RRPTVGERSRENDRRGGAAGSVRARRVLDRVDRRCRRQDRTTPPDVHHEVGAMTRSAFVSFVFFVSLVGGQRQDALTQAQQKPVFRGGTPFVRVDAYPTSKDGRIVEGLKPEDFEITEDGKPQTIESFDYISFPTFTPDAERRDPESQRAGFDLA